MKEWPNQVEIDLFDNKNGKITLRYEGMADAKQIMQQLKNFIPAAQWYLLALISDTFPEDIE